ncbi:unnamed protein product [Echinostoma caproni]|uniref:CRIB domain-containing protein n=1 Tax=Echinostoma caproni TaxID=27848 RepID=A0A183ARP7_9TREM|nr:unnamed protein product [Echinostoma caproni]
MLPRPNRDILHESTTKSHADGIKSLPGSTFSIQNLLHITTGDDEQGPENSDRPSRRASDSNEINHAITAGVSRFDVSTFVNSSPQTSACPSVPVARGTVLHHGSECERSVETESSQPPDWLQALLNLAHRRENQWNSCSIIKELARLVSSKDATEICMFHPGSTDAHNRVDQSIGKLVTGNMSSFSPFTEEDSANPLANPPNLHGNGMRNEVVPDCSPENLIPFMLQTTGKVIA